jgi:hypothetical protein
MILHLAGIIPAGLLVVFQFIPAIRYHAILFHRINGYIILLLALIGIVGVFLIARHAFGGSLATQTWSGFLCIISILALGLAYYNIKRLQIDQHRAWMLRAWFWMSSIITTRIIMIISAAVTSGSNNYYTARPCAQILYAFHGDDTKFGALYPECRSFLNGTKPDQYALIQMDLNGRAEQVGAQLGESFSMAVWLALALHMIGVEIYVCQVNNTSKVLLKLNSSN